jgi:predicted HicB family RNase H-like nuclease
MDIVHTNVYTRINIAMSTHGITMHGMIQRKTDFLNMRIDPEVKAAAEEAAIADRRSLSSLVEKLLTDYCREHGFLKLERKAKRS